MISFWTAFKGRSGDLDGKETVDSKYSREADRAVARSQFATRAVRRTACINRKEKFMSRSFLIAASAWVLLGSTIGWAAETGPEGRAWHWTCGLTKGTRRGRIPARRAGGIRVTFVPRIGPACPFPAPSGRAWDWISQGFLLIELKNPDPHDLELGIRIDDDPAADGKSHCRTAQVKLKPFESTTVAVAMSRVDPMAHGMRGLPALAGTRNVTTSGSGPFDLRHVVVFQIFLHQPTTSRHLEIHSAKLVPALSLDGIVDRFGQYARLGWPGKVQSESDLLRRHEIEAADIKTHPAPPDRNRFGGWRTGPNSQPRDSSVRQGERQMVAGRSRRSALLLLGLDCVVPEGATILSGRESCS